MLAGIQSAIIVLLAADRWVHKVTGKQSLESRIGDVEAAVETANEKLSVTLSKIQTGIVEIQVLQARQDEHLNATDRRVEELRARQDRR